MKKIICLLLLSTGLYSCFLFKEFRAETFAYNNKQSKVIPVIVPKGFSRSNITIDSLGNTQKFFQYGGNAFLYIAFLKDTSIALQPIKMNEHIPKAALSGGIFYKGIDSTYKYWREIRQKNFRVGYKNVKGADEGVFDSAINFIHLQHLKISAQLIQ